MSECARGAVSSVVEVGEGAPVVGTPARARGRAGGAQTLAAPGRRGRRESACGPARSEVQVPDRAVAGRPAMRARSGKP